MSVRMSVRAGLMLSLLLAGLPVRELRAAEPVAEASHGTPQGSVVMLADISDQGSTENCRVVSSTDSRYNEAALKYCQQAHHDPAMLNGMPVRERDHRFTVHFDQEPSGKTGAEGRGPSGTAG